MMSYPKGASLVFDRAIRISQWWVLNHIVLCLYWVAVYWSENRPEKPQYLAFYSSAFWKVLKLCVGPENIPNIVL